MLKPRRYRIARHAYCCLLILCVWVGHVGGTHAQFTEAGGRTDAPPKPARRPNVLFLAIDDLRDWVGELGGYRATVHTPNIDRLAAEGVLFTNAHCASPKCAPSRAAILTGRYPSSTGLYDNNQWLTPHLPDIVTLPDCFRSHGYETVGAGKIAHHTAGNNPPSQWDDFQRLTFRNDPWFRGSKRNYPWSEAAPYPPGFPFCGVAGLGHENDWGTLDIDEREYDDVHTADYAVRFLEKARPHQRPFFLACGIFRPHLPWYVPQKYFELYPLEEIQLPAVRDDDLADVPAEGRRLALARHGDFDRIEDAGRWKHAVQAYLAAISFADQQVGCVLDALRRSQYANNTVVVLWSDHGWHLGEKGHWHKSTLWEAATRVPLVVAGPGVSSARCARPVSLVDLFPTLIELCEFNAVANHDGVSLVPLLRDPQMDWDRPARIEYLEGNAAVRSERFRYIRYHDGGEELYDHDTDPHEWTNVADDRDYLEFKAELAAWLPTDWASPAPAKNAYTFNPETYTWVEKRTGKRTSGQD